MTSAVDPLSQVRECNIPFASCYAYSPGHLCADARLLRFSVKAGDVKSLLDGAMRRDVNPPCVGYLEGFFRADAVLVPVPGSVPHHLSCESATGRLAVALMRRGLGRKVWFGLHRVGAIRRSGTAAHGSRPSVRAHFDSMDVRSIDFPAPSAIILIDDVVTKGRTLLAAALRLRGVLPEADIRAFALLRTLGYAAVAGGLLQPCMGTIAWKREDARRIP